MFPPSALDWLLETVAINSGTRNLSGVRKVQERVAESLTALGFEIEWIPPSGIGQEAVPLLVGRNRVGKKNPVATLVCHSDTVYENKGARHPIHWSTDRRTIQAAGIIDDKASISVGLEACRRFFSKFLTRNIGIQFVCSPTEEIGSPGFHEYFYRLSKRSSVVFGLEPALENGDFVTQRKGGRWYRVEIEGIGAHAGRAHDKGLNAGHELALKAIALEGLTNYKRGITVNLGSFEGGDEKYNVVCPHATGRFDVRYEHAKVEKILFPKIERILKTSLLRRGKRRARAEFFIEDQCPPMEARKESASWVKFHMTNLRKLEGKVSRASFSGGGSDSSHFSRPGLPLLDALGACGGKIHNEGEFLIVESLNTRSQALADLLAFTETELAD